MGLASENNITEVSEDLANYAEILTRASKNWDSVDYPNSTTEHARIGIRRIFAVSEEKINVFSSQFSGEFWISLWEDIKCFLQKSDAKLSLITITEPDAGGGALIKRLEEEFPDRFSYRKLIGDYSRSWQSIPNYVTGDGKSSRFEESDEDAKNGYVSAVLNFGDIAKAKSFDQHFERISAKAFSS